MVRKAASEGKSTSVRLRFSGARLHIRNRGMKPILQQQQNIKQRKNGNLLFEPGNGQQECKFVGNWWKPSCKSSPNQVQAVVQEKDTDRTIEALVQKSCG